MQDQLLEQGMDLMLFGMGTVFVFLSLLVLCIILMSFFINKFFPEPEPDLSLAQKPETKSTLIAPEMISAISLALEQHRAKHK